MRKVCFTFEKKINLIHKIKVTEVLDKEKKKNAHR